jgi:hypothetical protein
MSKLNDFLRRHNVRVLDTNKRFARYRPLYDYFTSREELDLIRSEVVHETEPLYTIEIPESDLNRMQEFENDESAAEDEHKDNCKK